MHMWQHMFGRANKKSMHHATGVLGQADTKIVDSNLDQNFLAESGPKGHISR